MSASSLHLSAPAKLNLHLSVVGRRPDGYHLLDGVMVKLDLADELTLALSGPGLELTVSGLPAPTGRQNLVFQAAEAFYAATGFAEQATFRLKKCIPMAAGLGGGSSDAAAALTGLNRLYGSPLGEEALAALGLKLGADVPFFLSPWVAARSQGIGEVLSPGPEVPATWLFLLVNPGWPLSTAWVFKNLRLGLTTSPKGLINSALNAGSFAIDRLLYNDLESVVLPRFPEVKAIREQLLACGASGALMTGSGPTVFGIFTRRDRLRRAGTVLKEFSHGKWVVLETRRLPSPQPGA
jgi:4-diphosphocytidyl-2-C-methyl-D-erythritol kinase